MYIWWKKLSPDFLKLAIGIKFSVYSIFNYIAMRQEMGAGQVVEKQCIIIYNVPLKGPY